MSFNELIKLLEANGFRLDSAHGAIRICRKSNWPDPVRVDYHGAKEVPKSTLKWIIKAAGIREKRK